MARKTIDEIRNIVQTVVKQVGSRCPFKIAKYLDIVVCSTYLADADGYWMEEQRVKGVLLNNELSYDRQSLVLAHEIGHAVMHYDINTSFMRAYTHFSTDSFEVEANLFAFELIFDESCEGESVDALINQYGLNKDEIQLMYERIEGQRKLGDYESW